MDIEADSYDSDNDYKQIGFMNDKMSDISNDY